ncbi:hypothetical protein COTS27_01377 [Spirochaetota bacterium]|nr:hypothetical protein COTS27_01377 [Spirochaetota bacterium]
MKFLNLGILLIPLGIPLGISLILIFLLLYGQAEQSPSASDTAPRLLPGYEVDALENAAEQDSADVVTNERTMQVVSVRDVFVIKIVLTTPNDLIILSYLDKKYLENLGLVRNEEDVFFTFQAKQVGTTKLIFDRLTPTLEPKYLSYTITIVNAKPVAAQQNSATDENSLEDEARREQQAYYDIIQGFIASGNVKAAEQAFLDYNDDLSADYSYRLDVVINLAYLYSEEAIYDKALALINSELNAGDLDANAYRRLQFSKGYLERSKGDYEAAFKTWVGLKRELGAKSSHYGRILFELGETLFATEQYRAAANEYQMYLNYYARHRKKIAPPDQHFTTLYRLANIYELDEKLLDYERAYQYYKDAQRFYTTYLAQTDLASSRYAAEQKLMRERIQFISDHFINVR